MDQIKEQTNNDNSANQPDFFNKLFKKVKSNPLIAIVILILLISVIWYLSFSSQEFPREEKDYYIKDYGFELQYPYSVKESANKVIFTGQTKNSNLFQATFYPGESINDKIEEIKKKISNKKGEIDIERDVRVNNCTFRKIVANYPSGELYNYYFIYTGGATVIFEGKEAVLEQDQEDLKLIEDSITCK